MCQLKNVAAYLLVILFSNVVIAAENSSEATKQQETLRGPAEFQKVVDDYKAYAATVPSEIRDEIIAYRK